ncbi:MAG: hypothetical protein JW808_09760 [Victivallales bacterium]|nr:hypothetical protein [Victivallales bacterium]
MILTKDFEDFIELLIKHKVEFLVCGGHAVGYHGYPRLTMDFDLLVNPNEKNAEKIMAALDEFGFGKSGINKELFLQEGTAVTLGVQPNQIDLLTSVSSQPTKDVLKHAVTGKLAQFDVLYISREDLIRAKKEAGRPKDIADIYELDKIG